MRFITHVHVPSTVLCQYSVNLTSNTSLSDNLSFSFKLRQQLLHQSTITQDVRQQSTVHDESVETLQSRDAKGLRTALLEYCLHLPDGLVWNIRKLEDDRLEQFKENEVDGWRFLPHALSQLSQRL